jgi:hypothetical protein
VLEVNNLETGVVHEHLPRLVSLLHDEVGKKAGGLRAAAEGCAREWRVLDERLRDALEVREAHGLARPDAEYIPAQDHALEQLILETRDVGALEELGRREFGRDAAWAAGRSLAREIILTAGAYADAVAHDGPNRMIAEDVGGIPDNDPLAAKMRAYLDCRREERESAEEFLRACREIGARQQARSLELTGREATAVFTAGEYESVARNVSKVKGDQEHDRLVKEINRARVEGTGGAFEPAETLPYRTFHVREGDPRARAGLLMGRYMCKQAEFVELHQTKQPYSEALPAADQAKLEMEKPVAHHRREYGAEPVAILGGGQADYVASVTRRFVNYDAVNLGKAAERALVIGRSGADRPTEVAIPPAPHRETAGPVRPRDTPGPSSRYHSGNSDGGRGRS